MKQNIAGVRTKWLANHKIALKMLSKIIWNTKKDLFGVYDSDHGYFGECDVEVVRVGHPYYYVPEVDGERAIWNVLDYNLDDEIAEYSDDYMKDVKNEHMDELSEELTKVFQAWEKRHGYENKSWVVQETKTYRIEDYVKE